MTPVPLRLLLVLGAILVVAAWAAPANDRPTDRDTYEATASRIIVPDCSDLHCFRVLVPWVLGAVPGPSLLKWKAFAVIGNLLAAWAVYAMSLAWGLRPRVAMIAAVLSALGFGSLYTLYDPFTADPLMYAVGPFLVWLILRDRLVTAGAIAAVSVLAKEFAAAPLVIASAASAIAARYADALRLLAAANVALIIWLAAQLVLIIGFNYSYDNNASTHLLEGGYLWRWLSAQQWYVSALAVYGVLGTLWLLAPAGFTLAPASMRRYVIAAIPVALIFAYVQQPDRAFWNFHFLAAPLAALVLDRAPAVVAWGCVLTFALANLRLGAQLANLPPSRVTLAISALLAVLCIFQSRRAAAPMVAAS